LKVISLYSIKGGVGKTAACVNLAYTAAASGIKTLLLDLDPQGAASYYYRVSVSRKYKTKSFLKGGKQIDKNIKGTDYSKLDSLPATLSYRKMDVALHNFKHSKRKLADLLKPLKKEYQCIFLDCPPNITLVSENVFRATDLLVVPVIPTTLSVLTYEKLIGFYRNQKLKRSQIIPFFSMVEKQKSLHKKIMAEFSEKEKRLLKNYVPYSADVEKMGIYREPVACYKPRSKAVTAYEDIWSELSVRLKLSG